MQAGKILFEDDDYKFMQQYKKATGIPIQRFVTEAIKNHISKIKVDNILRDQPLMNPIKPE